MCIYLRPKAPTSSFLLFFFFSLSLSPPCTKLHVTSRHPQLRIHRRPEVPHRQGTLPESDRLTGRGQFAAHCLRILLHSSSPRQPTLFSRNIKTGPQPREQKHVGWLEHDGRHRFLLLSRRGPRRPSAGVFADKGFDGCASSTRK